MADFGNNVYFKIAQSTGVFTAEELVVLKGMLAECQSNQELNYILIDEADKEIVKGFIIFGRTPLTEFCWDFYWLAVSSNFQGKGTGKKLLEKAEDFILRKNKQAVIRVETSARKEYAHARNLYVRRGFKEAGRIHGFYSIKDDLVIFYKEFG
ncbi:MAG: GNAT family N-acetyltransferase [Candidatus Omnitrophota bacterium]